MDRNAAEIKQKRTFHWKNLASFASLLGFCVLLLVLDEYFTQSQQTRHILWMVYREYQATRPIYAFSTFILCFLCLTVYCWAAFRACRPVRVILCLYFVMAIFIEYGYFHTFRRFMTSVDFWTAAFSPWSLWVEAIGMYFNKQAVIISAVFISAVALNWRKERSRSYPEVILLICVIAMWLIRMYLPFDQRMGISAFQYTRLLEDIRPADRLFGEREQIETIQHTTPANNIILVIDESLRGDHLGINGYQRNTTPSLRKLAEKGLLTNWGIAAASATCSIYSNPHILTGVLSSPGSDNRLTFHWPTIFQYARAMGYKTQYLDAQASYLWNGLLPNDLNDIDIHLTTDYFGKNKYSDHKAAAYIYQQVAQSTGNFIVLNKMGTHILYENNYPASDALWLPTPRNSEYRVTSEVINAYDNAVHYNQENFFSNLMPDQVELPHTLILYTSDHGETLQENGATWSHCHNSQHEAMVPLFIIGRLPAAPDTNFKASHANIMATLLDLMNVPEDQRIHEYAESLLKTPHGQNNPRYFLDGDLQPVEFTIN